jgi:hypothetical protein
MVVGRFIEVGGWTLGCGIFGTKWADDKIFCPQSDRTKAEFTIHEHTALFIQSFLQYQVDRVTFPNLSIQLTDHSVEIHLLILYTSILVMMFGRVSGIM